MGYPERIIPDETDPGIVALHAKRYRFALPYCAGKEVLDAACGVGYGSAILAEEATRVLGVDISDEAIAYARERYGGPRVEFASRDLLDLGLPDGSFDVVCSFETIEHLPRAGTGRYLAELARVLRPGGTYIVSTPHAERTTEAPENPHHLVEFSREDFERLLAGVFEDVRVYGQTRIQTTRHRLAQRLDVFGLRRRLPFLRRASTSLLGTHPTAELTETDILIAEEGLEQATELIAVCRRP